VFEVVISARSADTMSVSVKRGAVLATAGPIPGVFPGLPVRRRAVPAEATAAELVASAMRLGDLIFVEHLE